MNIDVRQIQDPQTLNAARVLLHQYYVQTLGWVPALNNLSGIKTVKGKQGLMLIDDYDEHCTWFGAFTGKKLVACARLCRSNDLSLLEIERYPNAMITLAPLLAEKKILSIAEFNREAIAPEYADDSRIMLLLLQAILLDCYRASNSILTTSNLYEWCRIYTRISFPILHGKEFKYSATDPLAAEVYFARHEEIYKMLSKIREINLQNTAFIEGKKISLPSKGIENAKAYSN